MDIKLKNIKYSKITKTIAVLLILLSFMSTLLCAIYVDINESIIFSKNYYDTYQFIEEYSRLVHNVIQLKVKFRDEEGIVVSSSSLNVEWPNYERINTIRERLANNVNFVYYIKNTRTGEFYSNVNAASSEKRIEILKQQPTNAYLGPTESAYVLLYANDIEEMLRDTPYEVHVAVMQPLKQGDIFYEQYLHYSRVKETSRYVIALFIASLALMLAAIVYLIYVAGRKEKGGEITLSKIDKIYTDVHSMLLFVAAILSIGLVNEVSYGNNTTITTVAAAIILGIDVLIGLSYILSMVRQIKNRQILRNTFIFQTYKRVYGIAALALRGRLFKPWILLLLLGYGIINGVLAHLFLEALKWVHYWDATFGLMIIAFNTVVVYFTAKSLTNLTQIMEAVKEISVGNVDYEIDRKEISIAFAGLADNLQNLQKGLKKAVSEAIKGEHMKTELITNVSHDLKTPLTSIINYVDLLKQEDLNNENVITYIGILEEKSERLRRLVEDLIEASKASSGNLSVNAEKVDLHQLVMQAYGEYEEKLEKASLDMRINAAKGEVLVNADGRHLWRILENLLTNTLKYSMPSSRIYVNIDKNEQYGVLTIKNISAFPLEISPEQLTERFVRGDAARTTEGSGLGLSIAQGLTQLQGGRFKVDIDGDLFKVIVEIPLWEENIAI